MFFIGGLSLFPIELNCFVFPSFSIFSYFIVHVFCLSSVWVVFVITWQKGGEIVDMWESYLFCLGGVEIVFGRGRYYVSCFTLIIDLYLWVIHDICLYCVLCEIKNLFLFTCIFHTYSTCHLNLPLFVTYWQRQLKQRVNRE